MSISCEQLCPFLAEFGRRYACALQLKYFDWQALISHLCQLPFDSCESHIDSLLNLTVDHPHLIKYPIKPSYRRAFLKQFINKIEECDISHERTYEKLIEVLASEICTEDNYHFKHFVIGDRYISLKESVSAISQGTTGLCTWQAGVALANWGIRHKEFLCNRKVLELGSGSGLTGLALIYSDVTPSSYIFSDCHPAVLKQLQYNINLNNPESRTDSLKTLLETNVRILSLNWEDVEYTNFDPQFKPEVILAADVVYDNSILPALCQALVLLIDTPKTIGIVACTVRNLDTLQEFLTNIDSSGLQFTEEEFHFDPKIDSLYYPTDTPIKIFNIFKK